LEHHNLRQRRKHQYEVGKWKETITLLKTNLIISYE